MTFPVGGQLGTGFSTLGNIILAYGRQQSTALAQVYSGVRPDQIGMYDIALGFRDPVSGVVNMVGYVLTPSGTFSQGTDIQDEEHLVQVSSPLSTDRYGRFPKVSQGDWSGGERQLIFVNSNQYYQSQQVDVSKPGHLTVLGSYTPVTTPATIATGKPRSISSDALRWYIVEQGSPAPVCTVTFGNNTVTALSTVSGAVTELVRAPDAVYAYAATGIWKVSTSGAHTQVVNETPPTNQTACLAYFNGNIYYVTGSIPTETLKRATYPFPGAATGTLDKTVLQMEGAFTGISAAPTGLLVVAGESISGTSSPAAFSWVYEYDGTNLTLIGHIFGGVNDIHEANGVTYILCSILPGATGTTMPIIYSVSGSTITRFDDYRQLDPNFQPATANPVSQGHLDSDGTYLYLWWPTLNTKRYLLSSGAVSDCGAPQAQGTLYHIGAVGATLPQSGILDCDPSSGTTAYVVKFGDVPNVNGQIVSSYYDFGTPNVDKQFQSVELQMNSSLNIQAVSVEAQVDALGYQSLAVIVSPSNNTLLCLFPPRTIGHRARLRVTLNGTYAPDISQWSLQASLARTWKVTVSCRRDHMVRGSPGPVDDPQPLSTMQLVANIEKAYHQAGGYVTLYIPDPNAQGGGTIMAPQGAFTIPPGVSVVNAQLQDYTRHNAPGVAPTLRPAQDGAALDLEADIDLVLTETL